MQKFADKGLRPGPKARRFCRDITTEATDGDDDEILIIIDAPKTLRKA